MVNVSTILSLIVRVITSIFDWFTGLSPSFVIGRSYYFGFGFTTLD